MIAICFPYRDRAEHLTRHLEHLGPHLGPDLQVFVGAQADGKLFNRGMALNYAAWLAHGHGASTLVLHDVDMLAYDIAYYEESTPGIATHLAGRASQFGAKLPYPTYFGGVSAMTTSDYLRVNGYSNLFWGWGGEDDDFRNRVVHAGLTIIGAPYEFTSLAHDRPPNPQYRRNQQLASRFVPRIAATDGISSLQTNKPILHRLHRLLPGHPDPPYVHCLTFTP